MPIEWEVAKCFVQRVTIDEYNFVIDLCVKVSRQNAGHRPRYSIAIGKVIPGGQDHEISGFIPIFSRSSNGAVILTKINDVVNGLLIEAQTFIQEQADQAEALLTKAAGVRSPGKTEREREKKRTKKSVEVKA